MTLDFTDLEPREHDGRHLTTEQVDTINSYVRDLLLRLDLNYWRVEVAKNLPPEDCLLMIEPTDGRRIAMLYIGEQWWERDPDQKRIDLVHECLHLAHHDQEECLRRFKDGNGDIGDYVWSVVWSQFRIETERMVDSLSYVIAPFMPPWSTGDPANTTRRERAAWELSSSSSE